MKIKTPPIKSQGIKTKLVPWIACCAPVGSGGTWIEPFMGTGAVAFNLAPDRAILCDANPHIIRFYQAIGNGEITPSLARIHLTREGKLLAAQGDAHYRAVRDRFNQFGAPLDFLFLNRAGFNGLIRFNRRGEFNTPFCHKPERFSPAYLTKIANQIAWIAVILKTRRYRFVCQDFAETIAMARPGDCLYCDPPYIGRHANYFNDWSAEQERRLFMLLSATPARFMLSTWHSNAFRENIYISRLWKPFTVLTARHFYHLGGKAQNRNPMTEALVINYALAQPGPSEVARAGFGSSFMLDLNIPRPAASRPPLR